MQIGRVPVSSAIDDFNWDSINIIMSDDIDAFTC